MEEKNSTVGEKLAKDIADGVYEIGHLIVPQEFKKLPLRRGY